MNRLSKRMPPLAALLPFEAAARLESFSRAAQELHITQAAISRQIRALEHDLGVALFERRNRGVFLTPAGREFGRTVSSALEGIASQASTLRGDARADEVVLFCQLCEAFYWVTPRLASFSRRHPELAIRLATSNHPVTTFGDYFDVALQSTGRPSGNHPLVFTASDEIFPICAPGYLAEGQRPLSIDALPRYRLLHHKAESPDWMDWPGWFQAMGRVDIAGDTGMVFDSYPLMLQAALEGHGIALGWRRTAQRLIDAGELIRPVRESLPRSDALSLYTRQGTFLRRETQALLAWLHDEFENDPAV
ncbi:MULTISPECIES: LysR substrate-binding domain-containing protein [Halomonadaceae]|uniref:LysR substrate-binding domain-containing protein n=1 Tax=Halomonadaceae TaxID=28256 RepID=UPI0015986CEE|nr:MULTISPECIES: LysR substrate-binding domain-containing protein [Halomonas]QJQ96323.1 LysR family transcriptional regulator [Halomonas sp. PA5]